MKGPGNRLKFEVRRLWECPVCRRRERAGGEVVNQLCEYCAKSDPPRQTWMKLVEQGPKQSDPPS